MQQETGIIGKVAMPTSLFNQPKLSEHLTNDTDEGSIQEPGRQLSKSLTLFDNFPANKDNKFNGLSNSGLVVPQVSNSKGFQSFGNINNLEEKLSKNLRNNFSEKKTFKGFNRPHRRGSENDN